MKSSEDIKCRFLFFCGMLAPIIIGMVIIVFGQFLANQAEGL
jgi:hypothetical protein